MRRGATRRGEGEVKGGGVRLDGEALGGGQIPGTWARIRLIKVRIRGNGIIAA